MNKIHKFCFKQIKKNIKSEESIKKIVKYFSNRILRKNKKLNFSNFVVKKPKYSKNIEFNLNKISFIPYMIKDIFSVKNTVGIANNINLEKYKSTYNCTVYKILKKNNSIFMGKNSLDEFAIGSYGYNTKFLTKNPWNKSLFPGGSSSGSAVSVSAGCCMFSIATDTGGSVRLPSSINGLTGIKVTYGTISRFGMISFAPTFDTVGIISKRPRDIIQILKKIQKKDRNDKTSIEFRHKILKKNILIPLNIFTSNYLDVETKKYLQKFISYCKINGFFVNFDNILIEKTLRIINKMYYYISSAEAYSCLSKFDSLRYGKNKIVYKNINKIYKNFSFGKSVKKRIKVGKKILTNYVEYNYFNSFRKLIIKKMKIYLKKSYVLLPVFSLNELIDKTDKIDMYNTISNFVGFPSVSFRVGFSNKYNIPICFQLVGNKFEDINILKIIRNFHEKV